GINDLLPGRGIGRGVGIGRETIVANGNGPISRGRSVIGLIRARRKAGVGREPIEGPPTGYDRHADDGILPDGRLAATRARAAAGRAAAGAAVIVRYAHLFSNFDF